MSEYRQDPLSRRWVIVGGDRAGRPNEFVEATVRQSTQPCPFCVGNEADTPEAVATYPANGKGRLVGARRAEQVSGGDAGCGRLSDLPAALARCFADRGPRLWATRGDHRIAAACGEPERADRRPRPKRCFTAYRDRLAQLKAEGRFRYVQIFKNVGPAAGASLEHVHSQLVALPGVPEVVAAGAGRLRRALSAAQEAAAAVDMIAERNWRPASGSSPRPPTSSPSVPMPAAFRTKSGSRPAGISPGLKMRKPGELGELSRLMRDVIGRIERAVGQSAYNYFLAHAAL